MSVPLYKNTPSRILITGSGAGLGKAIADEMRNNGHHVVEFDRKDGFDVTKADAALLEKLCQGKLDVLINCAGVNHIDWIENFDKARWDEVMEINAKALFFMTQAALPMLKASVGTVLNIVSNASHMPMTSSGAYNASKGAAHILTLQLARELTKRYGITVFGISPNKLKGTEMSDDIDRQVVKTRGWEPEYAHQYQLNGLLTGVETDPAKLAEFIGYLLHSRENHFYLSGCVLPYGA